MSKNNKDFFIVGVGAAAGGLTAIPELLSAFTEKQKDFSVVIAQHHIKEHPEELNKILQKLAKWPFEGVEHGKEIEPGKIYLTPPEANVTIAKKTFCLTPANQQQQAPSIDIFFDSLAKELKSRAIGVLLSGYGNDGSEGAKTLKEKGGYVICQSPNTAEHYEMPEAVIVGGYCDCDLPPKDIFNEIVEYIKSLKLDFQDRNQEDSFRHIFAQLAEASGTDFSFYKPSTLQRRISKRLELLKIKSINEYHNYVKQNPQELNELFKVILIGVTEFFRNEEAFDSLRTQLINLLNEKERGDTLRVWSVGCAKGQEAYSLAIMIHEILKEKVSQYKLQIFATDIDSEALHFARKGIYKAEQLETLSPELVEKYFDKVSSGFEIKKEIRQHVLFSRHDITVDPPFVRLDMIICRNLLIYFNNDLQREALKLFHYVLNKNGLLFLGKSESVSVAADLYEIIDNKNKIFRRSPGSPLYTLQYNRFRRLRTNTFDKENRPVSPKDLSFTENAKETLFSLFEHPYVIINDYYQVKKIHGNVRLYLGLSPGQMDANVLKMVNPEFSVELRALLAKCQKTGEVLKSKVIKFIMFDTENFVRIKAAPLLYQMNKTEHYIIIFEKVDVDPKYISTERQLSVEDLKDMRLLELEEELASSREHIQTFTEELEGSNEELQSLNEELQSANEELKSSNEELETSNEELQSANEELNAANAELRQRNEELSAKENELKQYSEKLKKSEMLYRMLAENLPNGTMGLVDRGYNILFVAGTDLQNYNLSPKDLLGKKVYQHMEKESQQTYKKLVDTAFEGVKGTGTIHHKGVYYNVFTLPILADGTVESVMFLNQNFTEHRKVINDLKESEARFRYMTDMAPIMVWMSGKDKLCNYFNKAWLDFTGQMLEHELGNGWLENVHPDDRSQCLKVYSDAFDAREPFTMEYRLQHYDGEYIWILSKGVPRYDPDGDFIGYIGGCTDINAHKELENQKDEFMNIASHELKTPLTTAKAYFQLVQEMIAEDTRPDVKLYVAKALDSLSKLDLLIDDLLDITRIEAGKLQLREEEINFDQLVHDIVDDHSKVFNQHKIVVSGQSRKTINADKRLIEQVIVNLISNAVKFSPDKEEIEVRLSASDGNVELTVKDNGIGIAKDDLKKIFEPFYQTSIKKFRSGLGLGLFISKGIIEQHGGSIWADSELGYGSAFSFRLQSL